MIKKKIKFKMLKNFFKIMIIFLLIEFLAFFSYFTYFINKVLATDQIIESQAEALNISSFLEISKNSTDGAFSDIDYDEVFSDLISGDTSSINILSGIKNKLKDEFDNFIGVIVRNICNCANT